MTEIGCVEAIYRYPVKSMAGEFMDAAQLGWHGIEGDRRLALRRTQEQSGFPWLTAGKLPAMIRYIPCGDGETPTHVRTPDGRELPVFDEELSAEIARLYGAPLQMMHIRAGVFDDATVSVIAADTMEEIARVADVPHDARRFRPNVVVRLREPGAFQEDAWVDRVLSIGDARVAVTMRDLRCAMVNLHPETAASQPQVMKSIVRMNENYAGVYGTVIHAGRVTIGQPVFISPTAPEL